MKIIIDTNILLSALIRDSTTRKVLMKSKHIFYYPEISMKEVRKHKPEVIRKSGIDEHTYNKILAMFMKKIILITDEQIIEKIDVAKDMISDPDDVVFVASCLAVPGSIIWRDDKHFDNIGLPVVKSNIMCRYAF